MQTTWDDRGVPTIDGDSDHEVTAGFGHAQAVAHATEVLELYGIARGRAAALWGPSFTAHDVEHARLGFDAHIDEWYSAQPTRTLARIEAFCEGFNAACAEDDRRGTNRREVLPVVPRDVVAHAFRVFFCLAAASVSADGPARGSSAWAVSAARSATGEAMLLTSPSLTWLGWNRLFEARTSSPGRRFHGVTLLGFPWQLMGYGPEVSWAHTVVPMPHLWTYELELTGDRYLHNGQRIPLETRQHVVEVRGEGPRTVVERRSLHGPLVTAQDGIDVAIRVAGVLHCPATSALEGWWQMSCASSVRELLTTQDRFPLPLFTIVAADAGGSIATASCGAVPVRPGGRFEDARLRLPGHDPEQLWHEVHAPGALPRVIDPDRGWVQNLGEPAGGLRSAHSRAWLDDHEKIGPDELLELKWQTRVHLADLVLDDLFAAAADDPGLLEPIGALRAWDRHADPGSRGYPLFYLWAHDHLTPEATGLTDPAGALESLRRAATRMRQLGRGLDAPYGEVAVIRDGEHATPASGGPAWLGIFKGLEISPSPGSWPAIGGDSWISLVRFTAGGPDAAALHVNGNAGEPTAPRRDTQVHRYAAARLRPLAPLEQISLSALSEATCGP